MEGPYRSTNSPLSFSIVSWRGREIFCRKWRADVRVRYENGDDAGLFGEGGILDDDFTN